MYKKVPSGSMDITQENINVMKQLFPEALTDGGKIDFDKLKLLLGEEIHRGREKYEFTWPGKIDTIRGAQLPTKATLKLDEKSSENIESTENLYIEGDNLEVLKILQKSYYNKIKMIYIDPPYNTGKDFIYQDNFHTLKKDYEKTTGQINLEQEYLTTNREQSGRYHTRWLNMMYGRVKLSRNLLKDDGVVFISIDDNELENLIFICNDIFGEQNQIGVLPTITNLKGNNDEFGFSGTHEYILAYGKDINTTKLNYLPALTKEERESWEKDSYGFYKKGANLKATGVNAPREKRPNLYFPLYIKDSKVYVDEIEKPDEVVYPKTNGKDMSWRWSKDKFREESHNIIVSGQSVYKKTRAMNNIPSSKPKSVLYKPEYSSGSGTNTIKELFNGRIFDHPKSVHLIEDLIYIGSDSNDYILDFFSGSATTAEAMFGVNLEDEGKRKFIMVQLPEPTDEKSEAYKAGYSNICEIGKERIRRAGEQILEEHPEAADRLDVGFKVLKLDDSNIKEWNVTFDDLEEELDLFADTFVEGAREIDIVYEIMLKTGLELTLPIDSFEVEGKNVYDIAYGNLFVCLADGIDTTIAQAIVDKRKEYGIETSTVVFKDTGFGTNDSEKLNCFELLKDAGYQDDQLMTI